MGWWLAQKPLSIYWKTDLASMHHPVLLGEIVGNISQYLCYSLKLKLCITGVRWSLTWSQNPLGIVSDVFLFISIFTESTKYLNFLWFFAKSRVLFKILILLLLVAKPQKSVGIFCYCQCSYFSFFSAVSLWQPIVPLAGKLWNLAHR